MRRLKQQAWSGVRNDVQDVTIDVQRDVQDVRSDVKNVAIEATAANLLGELCAPRSAPVHP
jgi:hypothetical protein